MSSRFQVPGSKPLVNSKQDSTLRYAVVPSLVKPGTWNFELGTLLACAACYGKSDSPLASGMNWGIFTLLGVIIPVLGCFGFCLVRLINKDESAHKNKNAPENITDV